ncbi:MAG: DinB family protein [Fimbriimonadaceae bacterium]
MVNSYVLLGLEASPSVFARLIEAIPEEKWDVRTDPDRFTVREVFAHLADWEPVLLARLKGTLDNDKYVLPNSDPGDWAIEHGYAKSDPYESTESFRRARAETVALIRSMPNEAFKRVGIHPTRGHMTISDQVSAMLGHDMYHVEQVAQFLKVAQAAYA